MINSFLQLEEQNKKDLIFSAAKGNNLSTPRALDTAVSLCRGPLDICDFRVWYFFRMQKVLADFLLSLSVFLLVWSSVKQSNRGVSCLFLQVR